MGRRLLNLLAGAGQALVIWPSDDYVRPARGGFRRDARALRSDSKRVASSLKKTIRAHGKQINVR